MRTHLPFVAMLMILISTMSNAQSWQWAYSAGLPTRTAAAAFKEDTNGNFYLVSSTDSSNIRTAIHIEKRDPAQQLLWQIQIPGDVEISDLEINSSNHAIVVGTFMGAINFGGIMITSFSSTENSGFICEYDESGIIQWVHAINPVSGDFRLGDLFIGNDGSMYVTSQVSGSFGFCAFHKLNNIGNLVQSEFNNDFTIRTFSHVLADSLGNVFLSGTCSSTAMFDTIPADPTLSYENFLVKYDSSFNVQWLKTSSYITFDHNNSLVTDGNNLYWVVDEFTGNPDTIQIYVYDRSGNLVNKVAGPMPDSFFPASDFVVNRNGEGFMAINIYTRVYCYHFDANLNFDWTDTLYTSTSGFPFAHALISDDSSFYLAASYYSDTLQVGGTMLLNPNAVGYASDIFVAKWSDPLSSTVSELNTTSESFLVFPNPASQEVNIESINSLSVGDLSIYNSIGSLVYQSEARNSQRKISITNFEKGIYFIVINHEGENPIVKKLIIQ